LSDLFLRHFYISMNPQSISPNLSEGQQQQYIRDVIYKLNCLMSWDLFKYIQEKYKNEKSAYKTGQIVEPAFEASAVFGRQLLGFLKIKKKFKKNELDKSIKPKNDDDLTIDTL
jgi:hypothetical protein